MKATLYRRWMTLLFCGLLFLVPTNLFLTFPTGSEYVHGLRVDYLIPKLYLSDLAALAIIGSFVLHYQRNIRLKLNSIGRLISSRREAQLAVVIIVSFVVTQALTSDPLISLLYLARWMVFLCTMLILLAGRLWLDRNQMLFALIGTVLFQSLMALYQWVSQTSVAGYFLFGEPSLANPLGLAKTVIGGRELILPYGTTAHPNILAGVLAVYLVGILNLVVMNKSRHHPRLLISILAILMGAVTIALTQSVSAGLTLLIGSMVVGLLIIKRRQNHPLPYVKASLFYGLLVGTSLLAAVLIQFAMQFAPADQSLLRRARLNTAAITLWQQRPINGVGAGLFTRALDLTVSREKALVPFLQPVHNLFLLSCAEVGIVGLLALLSLYQLLNRSGLHQAHLSWFAPLIPPLCFALFPIAVLDHYLLTIQSGLLLLTVTPLLFDVPEVPSSSP